MDDEVLDDTDVDRILDSLGPIMRWGFNSDKWNNTPKIIKYLKFPPKIMPTAFVDAKDLTVSLLHQSHFVDQRAAFESALSHIAAGVPRALKQYEIFWEQKRILAENWRTLSEIRQTLERVQECWRALPETQRTLESLQAVSESLRTVSESLQAFSVSRRALSEIQWALSEGLQALSDCRRALSNASSSDWMKGNPEWVEILLNWGEILFELVEGTSKWAKGFLKWVEGALLQVDINWMFMEDDTELVLGAVASYLAASKQDRPAAIRDLVALQGNRTASEWYPAMLRGKRFRSVPKVFPKNIQRIFDDIRAAFEALQADFERLPSVRLTPPPVFLRLVGPISTDLRPLHREKILEGSNVYSLGSVFLENLMCDNGTSWDLHSCLALVATKLTRRGRPYPPAFTSELSLLVKRLVKANPQLALQLGAQRQQLLTLKPLSESTGLEVSTTSRVVNDARIRKGAEDALMQRSLSTMISLSVRNLTSRLTRIGERLEFSGGFGEIRKAHLASSNGKMTVAVKYLRLYVTQATKRLYKEIRIWQRLNHPHVLLLLGVCHTATSESIHASIEHPDPMKSIEIVCPWMENGTLVNFLKLQQTEQENMEELRLRLLIQVCSGLMYLHSKNIVHSDLYGENVLVDSDGCARLADFGLSAVVAECRGTPGTSPGGRSSPPYGAWRWAAPELVLRQGDPDVRLHPSADIYSAGGLILQACTGDVPYSYYNDRRVLGAIITGEKPQRPTSDQAQISDALWSVIEECWQDDPLKRPTAAALESRLQAIYSGLGDEQA